MAAQQREGHRVVTDYTQGVSENSRVQNGGFIIAESASEVFGSN